MPTRLLLLLIGFLCLTYSAGAQQNLFYNHYFINPSLYNPSFIAPNGYAELNLNYRKQWLGMNGAPSTATLNLHLPLNYKAGVALTAYQDEAGLLKTTTGLISFAYQIYFGKRVSDIHKLAFGLSAGVTNSRLDASKADDINDPVLGNGTSSIDGQFGMHYQYERLKLAFAIPRLFESYVSAEESFNTPGINQINNTLSSISYTFDLGRVSFEPTITYRTFENLDAQAEGLAVFRLDNIGWVGGSYRQDYGAAAFLGFNVKDKIKVGYAYEFATDQTQAFGDGSHEVQLLVRIGKKQFSKPQPVAKKVDMKEPVVQKTVPSAAPQEEPEPEERNESQPPIEQSEVQAPPASVPQPVQQDVSVEEENEAEEIEPAKIEQSKVVTSLDGAGLAPGHYVVVGAFQSIVNAKRYAQTLKKAGYPADVAYHPEKHYYIVHMTNASTVEEARQLRDKYRQMSRYSFRDTWILSIE